MKVPGGSDSPLDLRMSPALRRTHEELKENEVEYQQHSDDLINFESDILEGQNRHIAIEHIEFVMRRSEIKSETSAMTSYKSVFSDLSRSGSMPEIHFTPKIVGHNFKKTISFETTEVENTPGFLLPLNDDGADDDVFYTPRASPVKISFSRQISADTVIPIEDDSQISGYNSSKTRTIWNLVSVLGDNLKFSFKKPEFVRRAADYFSKRASEPDEFSHKRRRTSSSSSNEVHFGPQTPPATKRQKIHGRKPINRMTRNISLN